MLGNQLKMLGGMPLADRLRSWAMTSLQEPWAGQSLASRSVADSAQKVAWRQASACPAPPPHVSLRSMLLLGAARLLDRVRSTGPTWFR